MGSDDYRHFVCIVAGENPQKLMAPYDKNLDVEPYIVYKYSDREKIKSATIKAYKEAFSNKEFNDNEKESIKETLKFLENSSAEEVFEDLTLEYDKDEETGDAISKENKNGKWSSYQEGKLLSVPFILTDLSDSFQARKKDILWKVIHLNHQEVYERVWEMVMEGSQPKNEQEEILLNNMKNRTVYFQKFGDKKTYVASNTAFWGYAFLSEETGWVELEPEMDQFDWMINFFDRFITNLPDDTKLTIYECIK